MGEVAITATQAAEKTLGQTLGTAGLNTLMGMAVVFVVLILITLIISAFSLINKAQSKPKNKKNETPVPAAPIPAAPVLPAEEDVSDDMELVAVIAAAIAEYEGTSVEGIVVRSIRKVNSQKTWKRG